jgi:hypothetical protein
MPLVEYHGSWRSYLSALDLEARNVNRMARINRIKARFFDNTDYSAG